MQDLFRGYIKTKNKVPLQKFKSNDNYIDEFLSLCDMTINNKTENLEERINGDKNGIE